MDAVRSKARIQASRANFEFASVGGVSAVVMGLQSKEFANRTTTARGVRATLSALSPDNLQQ
jgi:hypothetical protein